ncbi:MAG: N-acetyl-gamma-glutamyl-phosphate reductase [Campylobacterales bacterium]|nr:N-acetyl-gamma-glutamyl-phosphate reductase [Campylobacterales bacterium]
MKAGIVGASGYTGLELIKLLLNHPKFELAYLATTEGGGGVGELHPALEGLSDLVISKASIEEIKKNCEIVFLALPHKASMGFVKEFWDSDVKIVDLSADYRLEMETYEKHYEKHVDPDNAHNGVYGLIEYYRDAIKDAKLVASPGCYPTAALLGLLPFIEYIDISSPIYIDAKSGVSGAGKKCSENTTFVNVNDNIFSYNPLKHRHTPEIKEKVKKLCLKDIELAFVPHLVSMTRGELVSIYAKLKSDIEPQKVLAQRYTNEPFVRIREMPVDTKSVSGTHFCDIFAAREGNMLFISSAIDNLLRGASSQALAAANLMCGFDESLGLPRIAYVP